MHIPACHCDSATERDTYSPALEHQPNRRRKCIYNNGFFSCFRREGQVITMMSPVVPLVSVFLFLLVLTPALLEQRQQFAWKPQGRFGKRLDRPQAIEGAPSNLARLAGKKLTVLTPRSFTKIIYDLFYASNNKQ